MTKLLATAALAALAVALAVPAEAASRKRTTIYYGYNGSPDRPVIVHGTPPTRFTVTRRSFLDAGTETKQLDDHYADYAFPPNSSWSARHLNDYNMTFTRNPLPDPLDMPGWSKE